MVLRSAYEASMAGGGPHFARRGVALLFCVMAGLGGLRAQLPGGDATGTTKDTQFWLDYNPVYELRPNMKLLGEAGFRTMFPDEWHRGVLSLNFRWTPARLQARMSHRQVFDITPGIRYFFTRNKEANEVYEIRLHQDLRVSWPTWERFRLVHRLRIEERFEEVIDSNKHEYSTRLRYRMGGNIQLRRGLLESVYIPFAAEAFFNTDGGIQFNDVFRGHTGLGVFLGDDLKLEGLVAYHNVNNSVAGLLKTHDLVFRFRVIHDLN